MTVADLLEVLQAPDLAPDTPVKVSTTYHVFTWEWELFGAYATLAGSDRHLVLELRAPELPRKASG